MAVIREELTLVDGFSTKFSKFIQLAERASGALDDTRFSLHNIETATASTALSVERLAEKLQSVGSSANRAQKQTDALTGKVRQLVGAYAGLQGIKALVSMSDQMSTVRARLDLMNDGLQTTEELNQMIRESAMRTGSAYVDTASFVSKLGTLAGNAFSSNAEIVAFAEQINKQMAISGTSTMEASAAMLQLTQAMSSGVLRGEELNSILEQTPLIAQTIAESLGVSTGEMRELASEGKITADVVKNSILSAAEKTDETFENMPLTWGRVWNNMQTTMLQYLEPIMGAISSLTAFASENMDTIIAAFLGLAAAVAVYTITQTIATGAASAFFKTLLTNPIFLIATAIGVVVMAIVKWVQSVGGLKIAWAIVVDRVLYLWDALKAGFMTGIYWLQDLFGKLEYAWKAAGTGISNFLGDLKVDVLMLLQNMINGAIDLINKFIKVVNKVPGVNIGLVEKLSFGTNAAIANEQEKAEREAALAQAKTEMEYNESARADALAQMWNDRQTDHMNRLAEIEKMRQENAELEEEEIGYSIPTIHQMDELIEGVGSIEKAVSATDEDIKSLVDLATRRYVNNINLTSKAPVITVNGANTGDKESDRKSIANAIRDILIEQLSSGSTVSAAGTF